MTLSSADKILVVIPARLGSTRLHNKLLREINGRSVIRHTVDQVVRCKLVDKIVLATDDILIAAEAVDQVSEVILTQNRYRCGTDRCAGVIDNSPGHDIIINVQGDQPFINPEIVDALIAHMVAHPEDQICSLMSKAICDVADSNLVKVSVDDHNNAVAFSRAQQAAVTYQHIGVYGYRRQTLAAISQLAPTDNEALHRLEQLRWLDHGYAIKMIAVDHTPLSIDVPSDLIKAQTQARS